MSSNAGKIIIEPKTNVRQHELATASIIAETGVDVLFVRRSEERHTTSPDVRIEGKLWEFKAPTSSSPKSIERNLRKAVKQAPNIVFDARRMKSVADLSVERELRKYAKLIKSIKRLVYINRHSKIIDIK